MHCYKNNDMQKMPRKMPLAIAEVFHIQNVSSCYFFVSMFKKSRESKKTQYKKQPQNLPATQNYTLKKFNTM